MDERHEKLLNKYAPQLQKDMDLTEIIPLMLQNGILRYVHQDDLKVLYCFDDI